ncbi:MAG: cyclic nucleotide-binding domain-containing protein [Proteobacteria bacterium]|nr:cyclic nucleotide-binding domain-containing protein [Pseudomonadota bacterium]
MGNDLDPRKDVKKSGKPKVLQRDVYYKGQTIIEQGAKAGRAFYIEDGEVEVSVSEARHNLAVSRLGPGEIFGEMALIRGGDRTATVKALTDTSVTVISQQDLEDKIKAIKDEAIRALINVLIDRLREANKGQVHHYRELAEFQARVSGLMEKAGRGIEKSKREKFRNEVGPLLERLEEILDQYSG